MQVIRIQFQGEIYRRRSVILLPIRFVPRLSPIHAEDIAISFIRYYGNNLCVYIGNDGSNKMRTPDAILKPLRTERGSRCLTLRTYFSHIDERTYIYRRFHNVCTFMRKFVCKCLRHLDFFSLFFIIKFI